MASQEDGDGDEVGEGEGNEAGARAGATAEAEAEAGDSALAGLAVVASPTQKSNVRWRRRRPQNDFR